MAGDRSRELIQRGPGLKPYRARKDPGGVALDGEDSTSVLILRTHDVAGHQAWAERLYGQHTGDHLPLTGRAAWTRCVPWDEGSGGDWTWIDCDATDRRATPCIWYEPKEARRG